MSVLGRQSDWNHLQRQELYGTGPESGHEEMVVDQWIETLVQQAILRLVNNRKNELLVSVGSGSLTVGETVANLGGDQMGSLVLHALNGIWLGAEIVLVSDSLERIKERISPDETAVLRGMQALLGGIQNDTLFHWTPQSRRSCWEMLLRAQKFLASRDVDSLCRELARIVEQNNQPHSIDPKSEAIRWLCAGEKLAAAGWADLQPLLRVQWRDSDPLLIVLLTSLLEFYLNGSSALQQTEGDESPVQPDSRPSYTNETNQLDDVVSLLTTQAETLNRILSELRPSPQLSNSKLTLAELEQSLALEPRNPQLLLQRAELLRAEGRLDEALADYSFVLHQAPENILALLGRADIYARQGHHERVAADCGNILRLDPHNQAALVARGLAFSHLGRYPQAISDLDCALRLDPLNWRAISIHGQIATARGDHATALAALDQAITLCPESYTDLFRLRGLAKQQLGDFAGAQSDLDAAINNDQGRAELWYLRGCLRLKMGKMKGAIGDLGEAIAREPNHVDFWLERALAWEQTGRYQRAIADCTQALTIDPGLSKALRLRGRLLANLGDPRSARIDLDAAITSAPQDAANWFARGRFLMARGDAKAALADLDEALRLAPDVAEAWAVRAEANQSRNHLEMALADFRVAARLDHRYSAALCTQQAELHAIRGNLEDALAEYNIALRLDPNHWRALTGKHQVEQLFENDLENAHQNLKRPGKALGREEYHGESMRIRRKSIQKNAPTRQAGLSASNAQTQCRSKFSGDKDRYRSPAIPRAKSGSRGSN